MATLKPNGSLIRRVTVACLTIGAALAFILIQRDPGWQPFLVAGLIAFVSLMLSVSTLRGSEVLGYLALAVLVLSMLWNPDKPWAALVGLSLLVLQALKNARIERIEAENAELMKRAGSVSASSLRYDVDA